MPRCFSTRASVTTVGVCTNVFLLVQWLISNMTLAILEISLKTEPAVMQLELQGFGRFSCGFDENVTASAEDLYWTTLAGRPVEELQW